MRHAANGCGDRFTDHKSERFPVKDKAGEITIINLGDTSDDFVESIDFTVFPQLKFVAIGGREGAGNRPIACSFAEKSTGLTHLTIQDGTLNHCQRAFCPSEKAPIDK